MKFPGPTRKKGVRRRGRKRKREKGANKMARRWKLHRKKWPVRKA